MSSSVERCISSLTSFMAGFLPPPATDKTIPFPWQSFPFAVDNEARVLTFEPSACPVYEKAILASSAVLEKSPTILNWMAQDKDILKRVGDFLGKPLTTVMDISYAIEIIRTEQYLDPTMPSWLLGAYATLEKYILLGIDSYHQTEFMKKVRGGPMITQVVDNMNAMNNKNSSARNIIIFSAHDLTVHSLIAVLNVKAQAPFIPLYGDTVAIEMHQQPGRTEPEVQVYYFTNLAPLKFKIQLFVPNCGSPCSLSNFNKLMSKYFVRNFETMCGLWEYFWTLR